MKPPTHDVQADGSWKCGGCAAMNRRAVKECSECRLPFYSLVTTAAPAQIFCSRCGFLNDGGNLTCVQCDYTIRSTLDKISTDLRDSTNFLARDMGVNIHVKCPGCLVVCYVPPATACLSSGKDQPALARSMPLRTALPAPRQDLIEVEGDMVEL
ncbi:hypothetical protein BBO99_00000800 [Phytophthora kernoviae]|uniref:RanBP2-type domain-containing protein n=2 Tax=Phytophthora kernoviae TaxID=325452 RepID=A0A3R7I1H5_9STRA|nr:hypothetical protein G195_005807 [Phytophthora kernoviae 00238/432]KAG2524336.1 hypothetical protein JM16_005034 [Phytophthora kernoviae]KAG2526051.1 hypothetical protein JM18_004583 [Phytophthora kernoviae]RLN46821.1 hypothetical protein BBI17_000635 [Phytophthora kernoviae]RLN85130.1 hypothetical protein BBO99_00000800 [Phytophthora kernoviae]